MGRIPGDDEEHFSYIIGDISFLILFGVLRVFAFTPSTAETRGGNEKK